MKTRNTVTKALVVLTLFAGLSFIIATWYVQQVKAIQDSEDFPSPFAFTELSAGQSARLNVVNIQPPPDPDSPPPDPETPIARKVRLAFDVYIEDPDYTPSCGGIVPVPPTCLVRYRFLRRELSEVALMPGQAASLNFTAVEDAKVQAFIQTIGNPDVVGNPDITPEPHLVPSLEVRESNRTLYVVPALVKLFNPQPDPPGQEQ
ncbi:MAG TPA: hypothetical protein VGQ39_16890 [Pyrinomonadaceae bacterium]|nr:hypothetical protein [Pyrinomonadaceae bacterium]